MVLGLGLALAPAAAQAAPVAIELADRDQVWFSGEVVVETSAPASAVTCSWSVGGSESTACLVDSDGRPSTDWFLEVGAPPGTPQGAPVTIDLTAIAATGGETTSRSLTLRWDTVAPIARTSMSPLYSEGNAKVQTWATGDPGAPDQVSGVAFVARGSYHKGIHASGFGPPTAVHEYGVPTSGSAPVTLSPGTTVCGFVFVADAAENYLEVPAERLPDGAAYPTCTAAPLDDRALYGTWKRATSPAAANRSVSSTVTRGAALAYPDVSTEVVTVKAYRCSSCGSFEVRLGGARIATYSLRSARRGWVTVGFSAGRLRTGELALVASGTGPVSVDLVWAYTPMRHHGSGAADKTDAGLRRKARAAARAR